jgi:hypothetical protein
MRSTTAKKLSSKERDALLQTLRARFEKNMVRHPGLTWDAVIGRIETQASKLWSLHQMEATGGEPDVVGQDLATGELLFWDCSAESPKGRRSVCYDRAGLESRKEHRPADSAMDQAEAIGITLLSESQYLALQDLGEFDTKTSSWVLTPASMRKLGGALWGEHRYGRVFIGSNGAQSYYGVRGFRGELRV